MFLVCGEALFDIFVADERADGLTLDARPGGSPFNVAVGLARLGFDTQFFSGLSTDLMGRRLVDFILKSGVGLRHAVRSELPTALSAVGLNPDGSPDYAFYGERPAYRSITETDLPDLTPETLVIHIGSIATVLEPVATALSTLVEQEAGQRLISYDPNVRPTVEPDLDAWRRTLTRLSDVAHILKISAEDLEILYPGLSHEAAARGWLSRSARLVVVTRGAGGATGWTRAAAVNVPGKSVRVVDTVGAGDSYQAALLAGLAEMGRLEPESLEALSAEALYRLLDFAGQAAAVTCGRRGADLPHRTDLAPPPEATRPWA